MSRDTEHVIYDRSGDRKYYSQIPNIIDDMGLSPYAVRLYLRMKRRAGETGVCTESGRHMAESCKMSVGILSKAKRELVEAGLIAVENKIGKSGNYHEVSILDIWFLNAQKYSKQGGCSPCEQGCSPCETKKNPQEEKQEESVGVANATPTPVLQPKKEKKPKKVLTPEEKEINVKANKLIAEFTELTGIKPIGGAQYGAWIKCTTIMAGNGVTKKDMDRAIYALRQDGISVSHPGSILKKSISIHSSNRAYES